MLNAVDAARLQTYTTTRNYLCATALTLFVVAFIVLIVGVKSPHQGCMHAIKALAPAFVVAVIGTLIVHYKIYNFTKLPAPQPLPNDKVVANVEYMEAPRQIYISPEALTEGVPTAVIDRHREGIAILIEGPTENAADVILPDAIEHLPLTLLSEQTHSEWTLPLYKGQIIRKSGWNNDWGWVCAQTKKPISDCILRLEGIELETIDKNAWDLQVRVTGGETITRMEQVLREVLLPPIIEMVRSYLDSPYLRKIYYLKPYFDDVHTVIATFPYWRNTHIPRYGVGFQTAELFAIRSVMRQNHAEPLIVEVDGQKMTTWIGRSDGSYMIVAMVHVGEKEYFYRTYPDSGRVDIFPLSWGPSKKYAMACNLFESIHRVPCIELGLTFLQENFNALPNEQ